MLSWAAAISCYLALTNYCCCVMNVLSTKLYVHALTSDVMIFGVGAFERPRGRDEGRRAKPHDVIRHQMTL